jgi:acyl-CoA thioesterase
MHSFADVVAWRSDGPDAWVGEVPPLWMQGRASYGGLVAAVGLRALRASLGDGRAPRSIHTSFFGPVGPGPSRVTAEIVRRGRFVTQGRAELRQADVLQAMVTASFADDRDSGVIVEAPPRPARPGPEGLVDLPFIEGVVPSFARFFALRWTDGAMPFSGAKQAGLGGWCRHRTDPGSDPYLAILGLLDTWPPPVVPMFERPAPASTVTWSSMFYEVPAVVDPEQWWWYRSEAVAARHGYTGFRAWLYEPNGQLAATAEQLVAMFDRSPG